MHHTGAQQLYPALAVAGGADLPVHLAGAVALVALHIHFTAWLGEGEVVGTEAHDGFLTINGFHDFHQRTLQVAHGDALRHHQTFDLVEHGGVGGIRLILAEHAAGRQHTQGRLVGFHEADLHGACLRPQQHLIVVVKIEGIAAVTGGMPLLNIQAGEVVTCQLHLRAVHHGVAHAHKDVLDLLQHHIHGMLVPQRDGLTGNGHVHGFRLQLCFQYGGADGSFPDFQFLFDGCPDGIGKLPHDRALLGGQLTHLLQHGGQFALFAQQPDAQLFQRGRCGSGLQRGKGVSLDLLQLFFH